MYALIMNGVGLENWTTSDPNLSTKDNSSPHNYALFFFVTAMVIYACGIIQYFIRNLLAGPFPLQTTEFVDLCSICNISVLIFDESYQGYYLHGKSPYGAAEISQQRLRNALLEEKVGKSQPRGLTDIDPDL